MTQTKINRLLKKLKMPDIREQYQQGTDQATKETWSYATYLEELLSIEKEGRMRRRIERYERSSGLPAFKRLENFDQTHLSHPIKMAIETLLNGDFTVRQENVLVFGKPGTGKTHFVSALGHELIMQGKKVLFTLCSTLVQKNSRR